MYRLATANSLLGTVTRNWDDMANKSGRCQISFVGIISCECHIVRTHVIAAVFCTAARVKSMIRVKVAQGLRGTSAVTAREKNAAVA